MKKDSAFDRMTGRSDGSSTKNIVLIIFASLLAIVLLGGVYFWIGLAPIVWTIVIVCLGNMSFHAIRKNKRAFIRDIKELCYTLLFVFIVLVITAIYNKKQGESPSHTKTGFIVATYESEKTDIHM